METFHINILLLLISLVSLILLVIILLRKKENFSEFFDKIENNIRDEFFKNREEVSKNSRDTREEISNTIMKLSESLLSRINEFSDFQIKQFDIFQGTLKELINSNNKKLDKIDENVNKNLFELTTQINKISKENRDEMSATIGKLNESLLNSINNFSTFQTDEFGKFQISLKNLMEENNVRLEKISNIVNENLLKLTENLNKISKENREELNGALNVFEKKLSGSIEMLTESQEKGLKNFNTYLKDSTGNMEKRIENMRTTVENKLREIREDNNSKLEKMRATVEEKLQDTLHKRIGESFKIVSDRLEAVQKGLGEMKSLATGVGDLKRVLTNVKARGTWGEVQLNAILEQILTPEQYSLNVQTNETSTERVEFAVKLPGKENSESVVWLPIDSKFPQEDYLRLLEAYDSGDASAINKSSNELVRAINKAAEEINKKYINPPFTTDFAIMFLPTEGLYAEVLRVPGLLEKIQQNNRVVITGPTTISAILNSLRVGFRTLAIEKRSSEVWKVLSAVKTEFKKFGDILDKVKKQLHTAANTIEQTGVRTRAMERKLKDVEEIPESDAVELLELDER